MKMKSIIGIAVFGAFVGVASAASVDWASAAMSFGDDSLKKNPDVKGYIVYLSSGSLLSSYTIDDSFSASSVGTIVSSAEDGTTKGAYVFNSFNIDPSKYGNGDSFAFVASYVSEGKTYWNLSSTINTLAGLDDSDPRVNPTAWDDFEVASSVAGATGKLSGGGGWTAVPEPSTAALALAGLALLLKRRKA